jgi:hypothetical protein
MIFTYYRLSFGLWCFVYFGIFWHFLAFFDWLQKGQFFEIRHEYLQYLITKIITKDDGFF